MNSLKGQTRWRVTQPDGYSIIKGKRGTIELYENGDLNVWVTNLRVALKCHWTPLHAYDDGADYCRSIEDLDVACFLIKARKMRVVTEAMRQKGRDLYARMKRSKENPSQESV